MGQGGGEGLNVGAGRGWRRVGQSRETTSIPSLHLILDVNALFLEQLILGKRPVHRALLLRSVGRLDLRSLLPLLPCLLRMVEAEYVVLAEYDTTTYGQRKHSSTFVNA